MTRPTLVLLHGVGLDHTMWDPVVALLAGDADVVTPDLPGHGARPPTPAGVTLADLADGVAAEVPPGCRIWSVSRSAPWWPSTWPCTGPHWWRRSPRSARYAGAPPRSARQSWTVCAPPSAISPRASRRRCAGGTDGTEVDPDQVRRTEATLLANDRDSFLNCYRVFATADAEIGPELDRIAVPALAMTGECDPGSTPEMTRRLANALPDCRAVIVPGARHMLPVQRPREFVDCLSTFIGANTHV